MTPSVRAALPTDLAAASVVLGRSRRHAYAHLLDLTAEPPSSRLEQWLVDLAATGTVLVAVRARIVGVAAVEDGWLATLHVDPNHAGTGVGRLLLDAALSQPAPPTRVLVHEHNRTARRLYARAGFRDSGKEVCRAPAWGRSADGHDLRYRILARTDSRPAEVVPRPREA